jgi:hypothetical protein
LGVALIASSLAQSAAVATPMPPLLNRTAAAIAAFEDLTPPNAAGETLQP